MSRTFTSITSWTEFVTAWGKVSGESEAIGLLYRASEIEANNATRPSSGWVTGGDFLNSQVNFFLAVIEEVGDNDKLRTVALQRLIAGPMQRAQGISWKGGDTAANAYHNIVCLLAQAQHSALLEPPYPRLIQRFLAYSFHHWAFYHKLNLLVEGEERTEAPNFYQYGETNPLVWALCFWGEADFLTHCCAAELQNAYKHRARVAELKELQARLILPCLEKYLGSEASGGSRERREFLAWGASTGSQTLPKKVHNLSDQDHRILARRLVAKALLWCLIWSGESLYPEEG